MIITTITQALVILYFSFPDIIFFFENYYFFDCLQFFTLQRYNFILTYPIANSSLGRPISNFLQILTLPFCVS